MHSIKTRLHHFACNIKPDKLEMTLELFALLGCTIAYKKDNERWCNIEQKPISIDIQIIETNDESIPIEKKVNTHIAFLSDSPREDIQKIKKWSEDKNLKFQQGEWSNKELWFDFPDIFINFVIEIMHTSIIKQ